MSIPPHRGHCRQQRALPLGVKHGAANRGIDVVGEASNATDLTGLVKSFSQMWSWLIFCPDGFDIDAVRAVKTTDPRRVFWPSRSAEWPHIGECVEG